MRDMVAAVGDLGLSAEPTELEFIGKGPWDLVLIYLAVPAESWLISKMLDKIAQTARRPPEAIACAESCCADRMGTCLVPSRSATRMTRPARKALRAKFGHSTVRVWRVIPHRQQRAARTGWGTAWVRRVQLPG